MRGIFIHSPNEANAIYERLRQKLGFTHSENSRHHKQRQQMKERQKRDRRIRERYQSLIEEGKRPIDAKPILANEFDVSRSVVNTALRRGR